MRISPVVPSGHRSERGQHKLTVDDDAGNDRSNGRQFPAGSAGAVQQPIRFVVAGKRLPFRIPFQTPSKLSRDHQQLAQACRPMTDFDVGVGLGA